MTFSPAKFFDTCRSGVMGPTLNSVRVGLGEIAFSGPVIWQSSDRGCDGDFQRMPIPHSHVNSGRRNSKNSASRPDARIGYSVDSYRHKVALVFRSLLEAGGPPAIVGFVISSWVFAVNRMIQTGAISHILKECDERFVPSLANRNSLRAVFLKIFVSDIGTSPLHSKPDSIGWADKSIPLMPMHKRIIFSPNSGPLCHLNTQTTFQKKVKEVFR